MNESKINWATPCIIVASMWVGGLVVAHGNRTNYHMLDKAKWAVSAYDARTKIATEFSVEDNEAYNRSRHINFTCPAQGV